MASSADHSRHPFYIFGSSVVAGVGGTIAIVNSLLMPPFVRLPDIERYLAEHGTAVIAKNVPPRQPALTLKQPADGYSAFRFELTLQGASYKSSGNRLEVSVLSEGVVVGRGTSDAEKWSPGKPHDVTIKVDSAIALASCGSLAFRVNAESLEDDLFLDLKVEGITASGASDVLLPGGDAQKLGKASAQRSHTWPVTEASCPRQLGRMNLGRASLFSANSPVASG
jgi:hypothetical protein